MLKVLVMTVFFYFANKFSFFFFCFLPSTTVSSVLVHLMEDSIMLCQI